jgi:hypothetical protein
MRLRTSALFFFFLLWDLGLASVFHRWSREKQGKETRERRRGNEAAVGEGMEEEEQKVSCRRKERQVKDWEVRPVVAGAGLQERRRHAPMAKIIPKAARVVGVGLETVPLELSGEQTAPKTTT